MEFLRHARYILNRELEKEDDYNDLIIELESLYDMSNDKAEQSKIMEIISVVSIKKDELE